MKIISRCAYCGISCAQAHTKYDDRCVDCGRRYQMYKSYKSILKKKMSFKRLRKFEQLRQDYLILRQAGFKVPHDVDEML